MNDKRYKFYVTSDNNVIAVSTYAGKRVKGVAKCNPNDEFDLEMGKKLAAARCNIKIARKRCKRAESKLIETEKVVDEANKHFEDMRSYNHGAKVAYKSALVELTLLEESLRR